MDWSDIENQILERAKQVPYGFQSRLAKELGVTRAYIGQILKGERPIPREHVGKLLNAFGLELTLHEKGKSQ